MVRAIERFSDSQVIQRADRAVRNEHELTIAILDCLIEIDRRSLYLTEGYSSLFDFCTRRWRYSRSKSGRFIAAARCVKRFPAARTLLKDRKITACGLSHIAGLLTDENAAELLKEVSGKMYIEIEKIAASRRLAPRIRDSVRPIGKNPPKIYRENESDHGDLFQSDPLPKDSQNGTASNEKPEQRYEIRFSASEEFCRDIERARAICSRSWNLEAILGRAIKDLLEKRDPERKEVRRMTREARKQSRSQIQVQSVSPVKLETVRGANGRVTGIHAVKGRNHPPSVRGTFRLVFGTRYSLATKGDAHSPAPSAPDATRALTCRSITSHRFLLVENIRSTI